MIGSSHSKSILATNMRTRPDNDGRLAAVITARVALNGSPAGQASLVQVVD
jgi:hypothetical protein